jgi:uncharacterized surface protein with fasciclin (FAS1) repeats
MIFLTHQHKIINSSSYRLILISRLFYSTAGPFTVFAPNNAAFAKIDKKTLDDLLANKAALTKVLLRHVIGARLECKDLTAGPVKTVGGETLIVGVSGQKITFTNANGANASVVAADVKASNGVAHVIDTVI